MSQNEAAEDYIFATNKATPTEVSPINIGLKETPLRPISTNLSENKEHVYEEINDDYTSQNYDTTIAPSRNKYDFLNFAHYNGTANRKEQLKSIYFKNRKKLIIISSILFVFAIAVIIAVIMTVLATASKRIKKKWNCVLNIL